MLLFTNQFCILMMFSRINRSELPNWAERKWVKMFLNERRLNILRMAVCSLPTYVVRWNLWTRIANYCVGNNSGVILTSTTPLDSWYSWLTTIELVTTWSFPCPFLPAPSFPRLTSQRTITPTLVQTFSSVSSDKVLIYRYAFILHFPIF